MTTAPTSNPYEEAQAAKAVAALKAHLATQKATASKPSLFDGGDDSDVEDGTANVADPDLALWLVVTAKKYFSKDKKTKQQRITLPNPYLTSPSPMFTVCVITKDPSTYYRSLLPHLPYPPTALTIISPAKLRTHYKSFESRRQLERAHDLFLADDRIIPVLPGLLGKSIYGRSSKVPVPIKLSKIETPASSEDNTAKSKLQEDAGKLQHEIERAVKATYFLPAASASQTIKVGIRGQQAEEVAQNITAVINHLTSNELVKGGWGGLRAVHLKAAETVALPIWLTEQLHDEDDVLGEEEAKRIEHRQTKEGRQEREKVRKEKRRERGEKRKARRHWDSDAESGEEQQFVRPVKALPAAAAGAKRKAGEAVEEPASAKKTKVAEGENVGEDVAGEVEEEEEGGVKLAEPVSLSEQAKRLKIGDRRIAPPAPALKKEGRAKKGGKAKESVKRKPSKTELAAGKSKKGKKAYQ